MNRRTFVSAAIAGAASVAVAASARSETKPSPNPPRIRTIATEEGWSFPELLDALSAYMDERGADEPGLASVLKGGSYPRWPRLIDPEVRLADMDRDGIDVQLLLLSSPGVQIFEPRQATELAALANDTAAKWVRKWPGRFEALAAIAPQEPAKAALELERAVRNLGFKGAIVNSHTKGRYLDEKEHWPILEAAQSLGVPIYLHPREPSGAMVAPYAAHDLQGAIWGYAAETSLHALRMIVSGVFDAFPDLMITLGHLGEGIPFYLDRIDNRYAAGLQGKQSPLRKRPSDYFRENFIVTTSGSNWPPAVQFCQNTLGPDRVLFAVDYPFEDQAATLAQAMSIAMKDDVRRKFFSGNAERYFRIGS